MPHTDAFVKRSSPTLTLLSTSSGPNYDPSGYRYDTVVLDTDGDDVAALKVEHTNNDLLCRP